MRNRFLLGAGVALATMMGWSSAQAQLTVMPTGPATWYLGGGGGWTSLENQGGSAGAFPITTNYEDGFNVGLRAGVEWGPWRFEEEFRFLQNGYTSGSIGALTTPLKGNRNAYAFMTNAIYDFSLGWPVTPHIGAGIGAVILHDGISLPNNVQLSSSTDVQFGYQAIAGIRYNINPSLAFDLDYRYLATVDPTFQSNVLGTQYKSGYSTHNIVASLSVKFGAPPPPPPVAAPVPPAPPPAARRVFLVFFDWDRDTITPDGQAIIQQAADAFRAGAPVRLMVTGYTDRSGSAGYNQRLSERRANNVANAMARMGVPKNQMAVSGRGENDNRVPTAKGVREPQNRRVEIVFP